jgi:integrase/recombinase XerD
LPDKRRIVLKFVQWTRWRRVSAEDLDDSHVARYLATRGLQSKYRRALKRRVLRVFLRHLREEHVVAQPVVRREEKPAEQLVREYEEYLRDERGLAYRSLLVYVPRARAFAAECEAKLGKPSPAEGDTEAIRAFLLGRVRICSREDGRLWSVALRSFLRFLFLKGRARTDLSTSVPTFRTPRPEGTRPFLSRSEVEAVVSAPDPSTPTGQRDRAILLLLARLGLRAGEVVAVELGDICWRAGELVVRGKGLVHDRMPLPADVGAALALYLRSSRPSSSCRRVFLRRYAPFVGLSGPGAIGAIVRGAIARAGLPRPPRVAAHALRHSLATEMIRHGASLPEISQVLRHRSPGTAEIYAKVAFDSLREVARPWPGRGGAR